MGEHKEILREYREIDQACVFLSQYEEKEKKPFFPTEENMRRLWKTWETLKFRVENLEEPDAVFSMVKHHFQDFLESLESTFREKEEHPEMEFLEIHWQVEYTARLNRHPDAERCEELTRYLQELCEAEELGVALIRNRKAGGLLYEAFLNESRRMGAYLDSLQDYFPTFSEEQKDRIRKALLSVQDLLAKMAEKIDDGRKNEPAKMQREDYRILLQKKFGVCLDELLFWYREEMEKTREEVFEIAKRVKMPEPLPKTMREVSERLFQYEGPCDSPEEMLERANEYLKRTRKLAHAYVRLPEDEQCRCVAVPFCCKDSYPWGGYEGGDFSVRPLIGQMFLNVYNYRNVTDGWIKINALHEAYPGHHVQYVRAAIDETPETVRTGAKLVPLLEGTCLRTERAFEQVFEEDPFFPLFVAYRRHHAAVRICADLMLFYEGRPPEEVIGFYESEMGFDRETAKGQVQAQQNVPGYFTCYYYGMKKIAEWERNYGFSKKEFTELLFSAGYVSLDRFEEFLKLTEEERQRYFHEFCGTYDENEEK